VAVIQLVAFKSGDSIPTDGALGLLFVSIGMSFSISTCYPQQITSGAYTNAICGALLMYNLLITNGANDLFSGIPNIVAVAINATVIWYAASSQESVHIKGENVWGKAGNPKTLTVGVAMLSSFATGAAQIIKDGFLPTAEQWKSYIERIKLTGNPTITAPQIYVRSSRATAIRYIIICFINVFILLRSQ
jgi:hypothetical protein